MRKLIYLTITLLLLTGCARFYKRSISDDAKNDLAKPIDCSRAREDISILEQEKSDVAEQTKAGIKMFVPAAAARAIIQGDYQDRGKVATGEYNQEIDNKIAQIKEQCGI